MEFRVLGPLELVAAGGEVPLTAGRQRVLLATLLLRANGLVPVDNLVDRLWDGRPPGQPHETLLTHVMRLRRALGADGCRVVTVPGGYRVDVGPDELDLRRFDDAVDEARANGAAGDLAGERGRLRAALRLWRGDPLSNVPSDSLRRELVPPLVERRLQTFERYAEVSLELGGDDGLVGELRALVAAHPYRERLRLHLMLALHRSGRTAEALDTYADTRRRLADELGLEPCAELRQVQRGILDDRPAAPAHEPHRVALPAAADERQVRRPAQLPPAPRLVGRDRTLDTLDALIDGGRATLGVVSGSAGTGKTAVALAWAHRSAGHFPDGLLFARLHGHSHGRGPAAPTDVLRLFLGAFDVPRTAMPDGVDELAARLRSELAGQRVLVVLDDAWSADQVRPLLPPSPGAAVLVTSRRRLTGLVVRDGARPVRLDPLDPASAVALLEHATGRTGDGLAEVARLCDHLPLALSIAAARLTSTGAAADGTAAWADALDELLVELRDERTRLSGLALTDHDTDLRAAFEVGVSRLDPCAARVFGLIGATTGLTDRQLAAAAGTDLAGVRRALATLAENSLVHRAGAHRHTAHDLLRVYAGETSGRVGAAPVRRRRDDIGA